MQAVSQVVPLPDRCRTVSGDHLAIQDRERCGCLDQFDN
jgi:hypothetical protein